MCDVDVSRPLQRHPLLCTRVGGAHRVEKRRKVASSSGPSSVSILLRSDAAAMVENYFSSLQFS